MPRALLGLFVSWLALKLAELARRLLPPPKPVLHPPPATLVPPNRERYVRELVRLDLVRADALLGFVLSDGPVFYDGRHFAKIGDPTWRQ